MHHDVTVQINVFGGREGRPMLELPFGDESPPPTLRLFEPEPTEPRIRNPGLAQDTPDSGSSPGDSTGGSGGVGGPPRGSIDDFAAGFADGLLPPDFAAEYSANVTLPEFHEHAAAGEAVYDGRTHKLKPREKRVDKHADGTVERDGQAVRAYEKYSPLPDGVSRFGWRGLPLRAISERYLRETWQAMVAAGKKVSYVNSLRNHVQGILKHAEEVGAIERAPKVRKLEGERPRVRILPFRRFDEASESNVFDWLPFAKVYESLGSAPLRMAFRVAAECGLRTNDLLRLRWSQILLEGAPDQGIGFPVLDFTAKKSRKLQGVPLPPHLVRAFRAYRPRLFENDWVFDDVANPKHADPKKSAAGRRSTKRLSAALKSVGVDVRCPWHCLRKTLNERCESHSTGLGQWILAHGTDGVNVEYYRSPDADIYERRRTMPFPPCFEDG